MRTTMAVVLLTAVVSISWFCRDLSVRAQAGNREGVPQTCVDINGDFATDVSDAVYLLEHLFLGGAPPMACAAPRGLEERVSALEDRLAESAFGRQVAGTYSAEVVVTDGPVFAALNTLNADGTYVTETSVDFGAGGGAAFAFRSGGRGNWRRVATGEIAATYIHFNYDAEGNLTAVEKINASAVFDRDFVTAQGEGTFSVYTPDQDPFGDDPPRIFSGTATVSMRRVPVEPW